MPAVKRMKYTKRSATAKKRYAKKRYTSRKKTYWRSNKIGSTVGYPRTLKFKHKYVDTVRLNFSGLGAVAQYRVRCNGLFDPDQTGTGHQPAYFDNLSSIYNYYSVIGSKIKWTIVPNGIVAQPPYRVITFINDDTTAPVQNVMEETNRSQTRLCQGGINPDKITLYQKWSAKKQFGTGLLANPDFQGTSAADPTQQNHFEISIANLNNGIVSDGIDVWVRFEVEYIAVWYDLKDHFLN